MSNDTRKSALELIRSNIARHGHHIYLVSGEQVPRFAYTIGMWQACGAELILAGSSFYSADEAKRIINEAARLQKAKGRTVANRTGFELDLLGSFSFRTVDASWSKVLMLGALDFHGVSEIPALQVVPDEVHWTVDVPDLSKQRSTGSEPVWQWLDRPWSCPVPSGSVATTNLDALRGQRITEAARWEEDQWELFAGAGPDISPDEIRVIPLGTLLAVDGSLDPVVRLPVGGALWRDANEPEWHPWGKTH